MSKTRRVPTLGAGGAVTGWRTVKPPASRKPHGDEPREVISLAEHERRYGRTRKPEPPKPASWTREDVALWLTAPVWLPLWGLLLAVLYIAFAAVMAVVLLAALLGASMLATALLTALFGNPWNA